MTHTALRFAGKSVLVTGAASPNGIGFATALRLVAEGARVTLTDIDGDGAARRASELRSQGFEALGLAHDVSDEARWEAVIGAVVDGFGSLDGLVNNAGISLLDPVERVSLEVWNRQIDVNLTSVFLGCRAAIARMRAQGHGGAIVNVSSVAGLIGMRRTAAYSASKGGVRLLSKTLALEVAAENIRVNSVHPGVCETDIQIGVRQSGPDASGKVAASIPMGRIGEPRHMGAAIAFLLSDDADYITGAELAIDGGLTAQ